MNPITLNCSHLIAAQNIANNASNQNSSREVPPKIVNEDNCRFSCKWNEKQIECVRDVNNRKFPCIFDRRSISHILKMSFSFSM